MPRRIPLAVWLVIPLAYCLYFYRLGFAGLLGPDEPRYASIGRQMALSGDWITPRLWGQPWFEKPALLYWMIASGFRLGLGPELAPRLPVAALAVAFLGFYWWILRREFGCRAAWFAVLILGTSAGWVGFSQVGVTDLPLTAALSAAMLLAMPWVGRGDGRWLPASAAFLGVAVLAKGLVPLVLAFPLVLGKRMRDLLRWRVWAAFFAVAAPWYALCYSRNGSQFPYVFFWQQTFERFFSSALQHLQPWWFYVPVLLAGLLPWTPLLGLFAGRGLWKDRRRTFLLVWLVFGMIFFSAAANKLPGYVLPLLPAAAALMAVRLDEIRNPVPWLAGSAALLIAFPIAAGILPQALARGLSRASWPSPNVWWLAPLAVAAVAAVLAVRGRQLAAAFTIAACATLGFAYLKVSAMPEVNRVASARELWTQVQNRADQVCVDSIPRDWRYGLNYYSVKPLPECSEQPKPLAIRQSPEHQPYVTPIALVDRSLPSVVTSRFRQ